MSGQHFLIVHEEPEDGIGVEHPSDCPKRVNPDPVIGEEYACGVEQLSDHVGLHHYFRRDPADTWDDTEYVTVGRHPIDYWTETSRNYAGGEEFDCGLRLSDDPDGAA